MVVEDDVAGGGEHGLFGRINPAAGVAHGLRQFFKRNPGQGIFGFTDGYALQGAVSCSICLFTHRIIVFCHVFSRRLTRHN